MNSANEIPPLMRKPVSETRTSACTHQQLQMQLPRAKPRGHLGRGKGTVGHSQLPNWNVAYSRMQLAARGTQSRRSISPLRVDALAPRFQDRRSEKVFSLGWATMKRGPCNGRQSTFRKSLIRQTKAEFTAGERRVVLDVGMSGTSADSMQEPGTSVR
jgi:hypothetical protein